MKPLFSLMSLAVVISIVEGGQECLSCSGVENASQCNHHIQCDDNEVCFMHHYVTESGDDLYDYGCASSQACTHSGDTIFGRRSEGHHIKCIICCNDDRYCNEQLNCSSTEQLPTNLPRECADIKTNGISGVYTIYPNGKSNLAVSVFCQVDSNGQSWTVIQRRLDGSVDFYRDWQSYKHGFGQPSGEYWLGNDIIHELSSDGNHALMINMTDFSDVSKFAEYQTFIVSNETNAYSLTVSSYTGDAGDSLTRHNGYKFTTYDRDNDVWPSNCAEKYKGGWWYDACHSSNLNGMYLKGHTSQYAVGIVWVGWHDYYYSLKSTYMMIRKNYQ